MKLRRLNEPLFPDAHKFLESTKELGNEACYDNMWSNVWQVTKKAAKTFIRQLLKQENLNLVKMRANRLGHITVIKQSKVECGCVPSNIPHLAHLLDDCLLTEK